MSFLASQGYTSDVTNKIYLLLEANGVPHVKCYPVTPQWKKEARGVEKSVFNIEACQVKKHHLVFLVDQGSTTWKKNQYCWIEDSNIKMFRWDLESKYQISCFENHEFGNRAIQKLFFFSKFWTTMFLLQERLVNFPNAKFSMKWNLFYYSLCILKEFIQIDIYEEACSCGEICVWMNRFVKNRNSLAFSVYRDPILTNRNNSVEGERGTTERIFFSTESLNQKIRSVFVENYKMEQWK